MAPSSYTHDSMSSDTVFWVTDHRDREETVQSTILFSTHLHCDILVNYVICFFYAHSPLRSGMTILFFIILSLVRLFIFSE